MGAGLWVFRGVCHGRVSGAAGRHRRFYAPLAAKRFFTVRMFLEESEKDYVRTARAKGVSEMRVLSAMCSVTPCFR